MKQVKTEQRTFGKQTQSLLKKLAPTAVSKKKIGNDYVIRDSKGATVATWHKQRLDNGLIVIH
jgi:hypothetical protein